MNHTLRETILAQLEGAGQKGWSLADGGVKCERWRMRVLIHDAADFARLNDLVIDGWLVLHLTVNDALAGAAVKLVTTAIKAAITRRRYGAAR